MKTATGIVALTLLSFAAFGAAAARDAAPAPLVLDGASLTAESLVEAARSARPVDVTAECWARVRDGARLVREAAAACQPIYGLTTGVGANKDRESLDCAALVGDDGTLSGEVLEASEAFNRALLFAQAAALGDPLPDETVRAILIARLNTALTGGSGLDEAVARRLETYLDRDILPVVPSRGSLGEADITILAHVGLTMIGEWDVTVDGERMPAAEAMAAHDLPPVSFSGIDALASFSSNGYGAALSAFALEELRKAARLARIVHVASLHGLDGNVAPFLPEPQRLRPFPDVAAAAADLLALTDGGSLRAPSDGRPLQDPLAFRTGAFQVGVLDGALDAVDAALSVQLNGADSNPAVSLGDVSPETARQPGIAPVSTGAVRGAVVPSANFDPLPLVVALEGAAIAAAHVSNGSAQRTVDLANPEFTRLSRFLMSAEAVHGFGAIQKPFAMLALENRRLADPISTENLPVALGVEDMTSQLPRAARRARKIADNLLDILAFELLHAAQAIDLRRQADPDFTLSPAGADFVRSYRAGVPFLERDDRILTRDIAATARFLRDCRLPDAPVAEWNALVADRPICGHADAARHAD